MNVCWNASNEESNSNRNFNLKQLFCMCFSYYCFFILFKSVVSPNWKWSDIFQTCDAVLANVKTYTEYNFQHLKCCLSIPCLHHGLSFVSNLSEQKEMQTMHTVFINSWHTHKYKHILYATACLFLSFLFCLRCFLYSFHFYWARASLVIFHSAQVKAFFFFFFFFSSSSSSRLRWIELVWRNGKNK